jgi:single-strand DNA-binding protein
MNFTQIAGHLGADPEERRTPTGKKVTTLRVATKVWHEGKDETIWWSVSVWGDEFDNILRHLKKGSAVCVLGALRKPRIWKDRDGNPQVTLELNAQVVSFSPFGKNDRPGDAQGYGENNSGYAKASPAAGTYGGESDFGGSSFSGSTGSMRYDAPGGLDEEMPF